VLLVCGIANPKPLKELLLEQAKTYYEQMFSDHHIFTIDDLNDINKRFSEIHASDKMMLTTEKDAVRLFKFEKELEHLPLYVIPVKHRVLFDEGPFFEELILRYINTFTDRTK
jgi:tetraacyldisaccharide 4'-kinase